MAGENVVPEAAVEAAMDAMWPDGDHVEVQWDMTRTGLGAALPHLVPNMLETIQRVTERADERDAEITRLREGLVEIDAMLRAAVPMVDECDARIKTLEEALGNVSRMRLFPDEIVNRMTLTMAITVARAALEKPHE